MRHVDEIAVIDDLIISHKTGSDTFHEGLDRKRTGAISKVKKKAKIISIPNFSADKILISVVIARGWG